MKWRRQKLDELRQSLYASTAVQFLSPRIGSPNNFHVQNLRGHSPSIYAADLTLPFQCGWVKSLALSATVNRPEHSLHSTTVPSTLDVHVETNAATLATQLNTHIHVGKRLAPTVTTGVIPLHLGTTVRNVPVLIGTRNRGFSFEPIRHEELPLWQETTEPTQQPERLPAVREPEPPPVSKEMSLRDRLLWLLTPPINELLSDPQLALPERPYGFQIIGVKWLMDRDAALLADEMGLGKTMQTILAARLLFRTRQISQVLIVCPKSLIPNWQAELRKWWPNVIHHTLVATDDRQRFLKLATPNIVVKIINYEKLAREHEWLKRQQFSHDLVVLDEAQNIKNPSSGKSQAVKALKASRRWAVTGTPLENHLDDVISIFGFVKPGLLSKSASIDIVRERIRPLFLRRKTEEVLTELPALIEQTIEIDLGDTQREAYLRMESDAILELNAKGDSITVQHVFAQIQKLKQLCNFDPKSGESAKLERLLEDFAEISSANRKALIFSQFVSKPFGLKELAGRLEQSGHRILQFHGDIPDQQRPAITSEFSSSHLYRALLLNYKTGGVGLNLQAANYVFLFDRWWNPAVEDQAVKRAHRIGAKDKVFVRRFICKDTIEERIETILAKKRRLFQDVIEEQRPHVSMGLSENEIFSLFNLTIRPRRGGEAGTVPRKILRNIDWREFQQLVALVYERQKFAVKVTGHGPDGGIDVIAERRLGVGSERILVQCKHQVEKVGRPVCQQLLGTMSADQSVTSGAIFASSGFSRDAINFASGKRIQLVSRDEIVRLCRELQIADFVSERVA